MYAYTDTQKEQSQVALQAHHVWFLFSPRSWAAWSCLLDSYGSVHLQLSALLIKCVWCKQSGHAKIRISGTCSRRRRGRLSVCLRVFHPHIGQVWPRRFQLHPPVALLPLGFSASPGQSWHTCPFSGHRTCRYWACAKQPPLCSILEILIVTGTSQSLTPWARQKVWLRPYDSSSRWRE